MFVLKAGVFLSTPCRLFFEGIAVAVLSTAPATYGDVVVVTSCHNELTIEHIAPEGTAVDLRYRGRRLGGVRPDLLKEWVPVGGDVQRIIAEYWAEQMRSELGSGYDVLVYPSHIHVEEDAD